MGHAVTRVPPRTFRCVQPRPPSKRRPQLRRRFAGPPGGALFNFRTYPRIPFYDQVTDSEPFFTDTGRVRVRLADDCLEVEDTGIGMQADELARAFEPFYRGEAEQAGRGLGLSIAHRLGQRCHWPLELDSTPGRGTRATLRFIAGD